MKQDSQKQHQNEISGSLISLATFQKKPSIHLQGKIDRTTLDQFVSTSPLVEKFEKVSYDVILNFLSSAGVLTINGEIEFELMVLDANGGEKFNFAQKIPWIDTYHFTQQPSGELNVVLGETFDFFGYLSEQINLNLPINLSQNHDIISKTGSGWEFYSETEEQFLEKQNNPDPRWEKLDQLKK